jgi:hypothetical protein
MVPVFSFSCPPAFQIYFPVLYGPPLHDGRHPWYVGVDSTRFGERWPNQRTTGAPTCRRLAPDFALFPSGYQVTGFPIGHPSPKIAKSAAAVRLSLSDDTLGDGFQEEALPRDDGFTDVTVRGEPRRDGRTTSRPGSRVEKAPPRRRSPRFAPGAPIFRAAWYHEDIPETGRATLSGSKPSRHYLAGSSPTRLPATGRRSHTTGSRARTGVAVGLGTMNDQPIQIGERDHRGQPLPFGLSAADARQHLYLIGKTGSGKTTLLRNLILQHFVAGHGVGLIDPHGDLAEDLLNHLPPHRADHLVYFNPGDLDFPVGLNLLANVPPDERHLVASGIVGAFKGIWRDSWGPRLEYILYNAVAALLDCQNTSLLGVNRLLTDERYRAWVVRQVQDPFIRDFWEHEFAGYDPRFQREAIAPIQNKLGQFLQSPVIRNILGQVRTKVSIPFVMDTGRLFLANLSKGRLGHDKANLLGSLLTTQFQLAAMARVNQPEHERRDFYLFIDEFQNFSTDAFASILAEARKYRLCLALSHQYIDQLSLPVRQAVFGNVGTLVSFRVGHADAAVLRDEFGHEFAEQQLVDLDRFELVVKLLEDGTNRTPFRGRSLTPLENRVGRREKLIARSRERFAMPRMEVEAKLNRWLESDSVVIPAKNKGA